MQFKLVNNRLLGHRIPFFIVYNEIYPNAIGYKIVTNDSKGHGISLFVVHNNSYPDSMG